MMDFYTAIVFTVGGIVGSILVTQMWQLNYFKRENFKFGLAQKKKEYSINFKKMERDLGLKQSTIHEPKSMGIPESLINKGIDAYLGSRGEEYEEEAEKTDLPTEIIKYARENPEVAKAFISKLNLKSEEVGGGDLFKTQE